MLRLAILGDVHYSTAGPIDCDMVIERAPAILDAALNQIASLPQSPDLVIQMGDLVDGTGQTMEQAQADFDAAVAAFERTGLPWVWIPGNHDVAACGGKRWLLQRMKRSHLYEETSLGGQVFLLLDSTRLDVAGRVDADQQVWLAQALDRHRRERVFVFIHHVFDWSFEYGICIEEGGRLRAQLCNTPAVKAVFLGHGHLARITTTEGLHEIATGALTAWPLMFRTVEITDDRLCVASHKVRVPPEVEAAALAAWRAHPKPWDRGMRESDLQGELILRPNDLCF